MQEFSDGIDRKLEEITCEVRGRELRILDEFAKAYFATECLSGHDLIWCIKNIELNLHQYFDNGKYITKYWFSKKEVDDGISQDT